MGAKIRPPDQAPDIFGPKSCGYIPPKSDRTSKPVNGGPRVRRVSGGRFTDDYTSNGVLASDTGIYISECAIRYTYASTLRGTDLSISRTL